MASIRKRGDGWRVEVYKAGERDSRTFRTKQEASRWALQREAELSGTRTPDKSLADAMAAYRADVMPSHKGARWEEVRLRKWEMEGWGRVRLRDASPDLFAEWRNNRLAEVQPATVRREMGLIRAVLEHVRQPPMRWIKDNPMQGIKRPAAPASRKRRISDAEVLRVMVATGLDAGDKTDTAMQRTGLAFLFALETAMRAGEIMGLRWDDVSEKSVTLPRTKNGDSRRVPLSPRARNPSRASPHGSAMLRPARRNP